MMERVRLHRAQRPAWRTLEAPADVAASLAALAPPPSAVILDCLTLWVGARFTESDEAIDRLEHTAVGIQSGVLADRHCEQRTGVEFGPHEPQARRFRDLAGTLAQLTSQPQTTSGS